MLDDFDDDLSKTHGRIDLELALKTLTAKERDTITLWYIDGYSRDEIAEILKKRYDEKSSIDGKTIRNRILTILSKLKSRFKERESS